MYRKFKIITWCCITSALFVKVLFFYFPALVSIYYFSAWFVQFHPKEEAASALYVLSLGLSFSLILVFFKYTSDYICVFVQRCPCPPLVRSLENEDSEAETGLKSQEDRDDVEAKIE